MADELPPITTTLTTHCSNTITFSKQYRELQFMVMRYNTLMAELKDIGKSRRSIYHTNCESSFEDASIHQNESRKEALEIQKAEIMQQLTKIREFVYMNGGCPDDDLLPLMHENQRRDRRESFSSATIFSPIATSDPLHVSYPPPAPNFGPFTNSMRNVIAIKTGPIPVKRPQFMQSISAQDNKPRLDTPVPSKQRNTLHFHSTLITTYAAPQHLKMAPQHLKEKSMPTLTLKALSSHSISTSISIPNSTTNEEVAEGVDIKLEELQETNESDSDADSVYLEPIHDKITPLIASDGMSLRAKLWSVLLDFNCKEEGHKEYRKQIDKGHSIDYSSKILKDAQRTFLTSSEFNSRVSEFQIIRILNAFVHKNNKAYTQGMDAIAGSLLFVMNESEAFQLLNVLMSIHFPLYFKSEKDSDHSTSLIGAYAGTYLAYDILKIYDEELFNHLSSLHPYQYLFPLIASFQAISQPLSQMQKLWDYLFAYGVYLNPVVAISHLIVNRKKILNKSVATLLMGLLSQRKWMNGKLHAKNVIKISSMIANKISSNEEYK
eukprot:159558_1